MGILPARDSLIRLVGTGAFAAAGELVAVQDGQRLICHECRREFTSLSRHLRSPQLTAELRGSTGSARWTHRSCSSASARCGLVRYAGNQPLRVGLAVGMVMAASGELLRLSHPAQPPGSTRPQARQRYRRSTEPTRRQASQPAAHGHAARLDELGFAGYLRNAYQVRHLPVLAVTRELRVGNEALQQILKDAGIDRRPPGASN